MLILIVDDDPAIRLILAGILKGMGFEVIEASDGLEALACLQQNRAIKLALVDWNMPHMSGYEFICAVRATSAYSYLRLMMVTAKNEIDEVAKALAAGADEYLMKPVTRDTLLEKLQLLGILPNAP